MAKSYAAQHVTPRHKVYVEIDGVIYELLPKKQQFLQRDSTLGFAAMRVTKAGEAPLLGIELKIARVLLRKALASIDARENYRQKREQPTTVPRDEGLTPAQRARKAQSAEEMKRRDIEYERDPTRFDRAPRGYWQRREARHV